MSVPRLLHFDALILQSHPSCHMSQTTLRLFKNQHPTLSNHLCHAVWSSMIVAMYLPLLARLPVLFSHVASTRNSRWLLVGG